MTTNFHKFLLVSISFVLVFLLARAANAQNAFPLDIVWSANTYVPPEFNVKPLPSAGSPVEIVALTPSLNPAGVEFTWVIEDALWSGQGPALKGFGKNVFILNTPAIFSNFARKVKVIARSGGAEASASVEIPVVSPEAHIYSGPNMRRLIDSFPATPGAGGVLLAKPFYFNVLSAGDLGFSWIFDGRALPAEDSPEILNISVSPDTPIGAERSLILNITNSRNAREQARVNSSLKVFAPR